MRSILAAMLLGVAAACGGQFWLSLDALYAARVAALLIAGGGLLMWRLTAHHPFDRLGLANQITLTRGIFVVMLAGVIGSGTAPTLQVAAVWVASLAAALDALDGWSARRSGMSSDYGARFDMEADALLILVLSILAWQFGKAGAWVLASGLLRYVFVICAWLLPWLRNALPPSLRRKSIAAAQAICLLVAIAPFVPAVLSQWICAAALFALVASFATDILWLRQHAAKSASGCPLST